MAIGAVKLEPVTSGRWTVTAEVASSSLVVPAIPNQALTHVEEFSRGHKKVQIPREASNSAHGSPIAAYNNVYVQRLSYPGGRFLCEQIAG